MQRERRRALPTLRRCSPSSPVHAALKPTAQLDDATRHRCEVVRDHPCREPEERRLAKDAELGVVRIAGKRAERRQQLGDAVRRAADLQQGRRTPRRRAAGSRVGRQEDDRVAPATTGRQSAHARTRRRRRHPRPSSPVPGGTSTGSAPRSARRRARAVRCGLRRARSTPPGRRARRRMRPACRPTAARGRRRGVPRARAGRPLPCSKAGTARRSGKPQSGDELVSTWRRAPAARCGGRSVRPWSSSPRAVSAAGPGARSCSASPGSRRAGCCSSCDALRRGSRESRAGAGASARAEPSPSVSVWWAPSPDGAAVAL